MKNTKLIIAAISLTMLCACSKNWKCETTITTNTEVVKNTQVIDTEFEGTKDEMKAYEESMTSYKSLSIGTIDTKTKCK